MESVNLREFQDYLRSLGISDYEFELPIISNELSVKIRYKTFVINFDTAIDSSLDQFIEQANKAFRALTNNTTAANLFHDPALLRKTKKVCPFCGAEPELTKMNVIKDKKVVDSYQYIQCTICEAQSKRYYKSDKRIYGKDMDKITWLAWDTRLGSS